jgi:hypothetical protein
MARGRVPPGGKAPFCNDCGGADCHVVGYEGVATVTDVDGKKVAQGQVYHVWLCGSCEFLRENPDAQLRATPPGLPASWPTRKRKQKETLF